MKKFKLLLIMLLCIMFSGCVKSNTSMVINKDKSMTISMDLMLDEQSNRVFGNYFDKKVEELKYTDNNIKKIAEGFYSGIRVTKKIDNIDDTIYDDNKSIDISKFLEKNFDNKFFTIKRGLFYNTYYANFDFNSLLEKYNYIADEIVENIDEDLDETQFNIDNIEYTFSVTLPSKALNNNADKIESNMLIWNLNKAENTNVKFSFKIENTTNIIIVIGCCVLIIGIMLFILIKRLIKSKTIKSDIKKDKPILKEYDPSIESKINNIGVSAQPIMEVAENDEVKEEIIEESSKEIVETPKEVVPEVSDTNSEIKRLNNYEIKLPEETRAREVIQYRKDNPSKKDPLFINNNVVEEEKENVMPNRHEVIIDKPDAEDINSIL